MSHPLKRFATTADGIGQFTIPAIAPIPDKIRNIDPSIGKFENDVRLALLLIERRLNLLAEAAKNSSV